MRAIEKELFPAMQAFYYIFAMSPSAFLPVVNLVARFPQIPLFSVGRLPRLSLAT